MYSCFNPRARAGRDRPTTPDTPLYWVSIHAPVRGATIIGSVDAYNITVSIHAPVRGATARPHAAPGPILEVSIHAPVRGATHYRLR